MNIRPIAKSFEKFGFQFNQIIETNDYYVYSKQSTSSDGVKRDHVAPHGPIIYEVFLKRVEKLLIQDENGKLTQSNDSFYYRYPSDNDFGTWAWTGYNYKTLIDKHILNKKERP